MPATLGGSRFIVGLIPQVDLQQEHVEPGHALARLEGLLEGTAVNDVKL